MTLILRFLTLSAVLALAGFPCYAAPATKTVAVPEKVGGVYEVKEIERQAGGSFIIRFESTTKTGRFDHLNLESDHVHVGVEVGAKIRLSAQILSEAGATAEVAQVLVFLPSGQSHVPVWLLSRKAAPGGLRGPRYLEMHAPTSDYTVL